MGEDQGPPAGQGGRPRGTAADNRLFVNAVLYGLKTGIPGADLPGRFGKPNTVWKRDDRGVSAGVWERVAKTLGDDEFIQSGDEAACQELMLDSTSVKAHPTASTGRRLPGEKRGRRRATVPRPIAWWPDDKAPRGGG